MSKVLQTKQSTTTHKRYYLLAIIAILFFLFLSQKSNVIPTYIGISFTLVILYLFLRVKTATSNRQLSLQLVSATNDEKIQDEGAYAKFDKHFNLSYVSQEFIDILGVDAGNLLTILQNCIDEESLIKKIQNTVKKKKTFNDVMTLKIANKIQHIDTFIYQINAQTLSKASFIIRLNDITDYITTQQEVQDAHFVDKFTQLPTRLKLLDAIEKSKERKSTHAQTLMYVQIDAYEEFNEFFGISVGHALLQETSIWLQENLPTKSAQVYKFDHNNFAIFTTARLSLDELENYLRTLTNKISNTSFIIQEASHDISFSIGVSRGSNHLLKHAYLALKEAQKSNKPYKVFNKSNVQEEKFLHNIQTNKKIKKALLEDRVVPFFQPILNIETNEVEKFESLIRIQNEDNTHLRPAEFLDIAKQSKLYPELTKAMVTGSLKRLEFLQQPITINLSIEDITSYKISSFIIRKLQRTPFAHLVTFEILETNEILNYTKVSNFIKKVKEFNCQVAIDDFGSGYSNFEQVLKLDIDYIKIDGSLIKNIDTNKENEIVTRTIVAFAKELGVKTIAEFVSSEAIFDKVKSLGIDYAQGYYIGRPAPITLNTDK